MRRLRLLTPTIVGAGVECPSELFPIVDFDKRRKSKRSRLAAERAEVLVVERAHNQEHRIRAVGDSFRQLVFM